MLDDWVSNGTKYSGIVNLPKTQKDLVYQLDEPHLTVVKLCVEKMYSSESLSSDIKNTKKTRKIGRNESCICGSGIKFKKCCAT